MKKRWADVAACVVVIAIALAVWLPKLAWGLPTRESDRWLFGDRPAWSGREILEKLATQNANSSAPEVAAEGTRGADVDSTPILDRTEPVLLNATDADRAAIVQRYRLMSGQPDEFIQFKALAEMSQRGGLARFDPRLYQYGGLWIYPVGVLVRGAMQIGWIEAPPAGVSAREFYLDRPDAFGAFFIVARAYSLAWGIVGAIAFYFLTRRVVHRNVASRDAMPSPVFGHPDSGNEPATALLRGYGDSLSAMFASLAFVLLPVVRTATHEAKPHLAGAAICLLAVLAADRFVQSGRTRWLLFSGALCGAAMGMVLSMTLSLALLPTAVVMQRERSKSTLHLSISALSIALVVYVVTNPFVLLHAIASPQILRSNLGNSTAMYGLHSPLAMFPDAWRIAGHAMTPVGIRIAVAAILALVVRRVQFVAPSSLRAEGENGATSCTLWVVAIVVVAQFILLADGKPAEYARFCIIPAAAACIAVSLAVRRWIDSPRGFGGIFVVALIGCLLLPSMRGSLIAEHPTTAASIDAMRRAAGRSVFKLGVAYEPAPWSSPPPNLFDEQVFLVRSTPPMRASVDLFVWPSNLRSQIIDSWPDEESLDWRENHFSAK